jgi:hypothetical protein
MDDKLIVNILSDDSKDIGNLRNHIDIVKDFLVLVNRIDALPETNRRLEGVSPYQAVAKNVPLQQLERFFIAFFGAPIKRAGETPSFKLKFNPSIKYIGEIRTEQAFFIRKIKKGEFYGAIWPWLRKPGYLTIHLGYYSKTLSDADFQKIEDLIRKSTHERVIGEMEAGVGGQISGITIPSFLQMAEMEKTTATLKVKSGNNSGSLYLRDGNVIDAKTGEYEGKDAACRIICWENVVIEIDKKIPQKKNRINEPLMHILMESLKIKDEEEFQKLKQEPGASVREDGTVAGYAHDVMEDISVGQEEESDAAADLAEGVSPFPKQAQKQAFFEKLFRDPAKKRRMILSLATAALVLAVAGVSLLAAHFIQSKRIAKTYAALLENIEKQPGLKEKELLLKLFINSQKSGRYADQAQEKLDEIRNAMDESTYREISAKVSSLPLTFDYDEKAKALYQEYLKQFPQGKYVSGIEEDIKRIPGIIDDTQYEHLISANWPDEDKKTEALKSYLSNHPKGKHRTEVENFLVESLEKRYAQIQAQTSRCDESSQWEPCISGCDRFLAVFDNSYRTDEIKKLRHVLQEKQDFSELQRNEKKLGEAFEEIIKIYADYLTSHPDSSIKDLIGQEIGRLNSRIGEKNDWQKALASSRNPEVDISTRIDQIDRFIDRYRAGPFYAQARSRLEELHKERLETERKRSEETEQARKTEQFHREMLAKQQQKARLDQEASKVAYRFQTSGGRYKNNGNGTFTDQNTGMTWCMLDSDIVLGKCMDYASALRYVNSLSTGGFSDWRLPSFSELAAIYKNDPFFPVNGYKWFWTSEIVIKGYHEMAGVVSSKEETVFEREYAETRECKTVHAVRP